jgi:prolipoprotein diacylglyceryltransferase
LGSAGEAPTSAQVYTDALNAGNPPSLGCFDLVLHQTALYDFFSTLLLLSVLLWLGKRVRATGFMIIVFTCWYGAMRLITDFLRVDRRYLGLTGSQLVSLSVGLICLYLLARHRGAPPAWQAAPAGAPTTESDIAAEIPPESAGDDDSP